LKDGWSVEYRELRAGVFQSPRGDFGFLKPSFLSAMGTGIAFWFQSPRGDFGFLKNCIRCGFAGSHQRSVSIPSRGFWFFEDTPCQTVPPVVLIVFGFNPLAGILVF